MEKREELGDKVYRIEIMRLRGRYKHCQLMTLWDREPPKFIEVIDPDNGEAFVAARRMGCWCEVDTYEVVRRLNGDWPNLSLPAGPTPPSPTTPDRKKETE